MDFNQLLARMQELDSVKSEAPVDIQTDECGMPPMAPNMPSPEPKDKASMSININAQGDAIEDVMALIKKMSGEDKPEMNMPSMSIIPPMGGMDEPEGPPMPKPINKLIPDFDGDNDDMPGGEKDMIDIKALGDKGDDNDYDDDGKLDRHEKDHDDEEKLHKSVDRDNDGDHDMDDHDKEKDNDKDELDILKAAAGTVNSVGDVVGSGPTQEPRLGSNPDTTVGSKAQSADKDEAWANEPDEMNKDIDFMQNKMSGGMNRRKGTHPKVAGGDNPMQKVGESDLVATIKAELQKALAETKGAK